MQIGPILGILSIPRTGANPFPGGQNESFAEIISVAERMNCTAYVFSPFDIDWRKNAVWGYRYNVINEQGDWERRVYPLPSVIYNRIPNRKMENREDISTVLSLLRTKYQNRFFNPCFLDKWKTHTILCTNRETAGFLPETHRLDHVNIIFDMLNRYKSVYLKPKANSLGNDILKITRLPQDKYFFIHQNLNDGRREGIISDYTEIINELSQSENSLDYLVQASIPLATFNGQPFDLRLLVQKNVLGKWKKTGIAARIAGEGSITTHVFYGGTRCPAETVLNYSAASHLFSSEGVQEQLKQVCSLIPQQIETAYGETFGELEMDIGVDINGKVWFLEANSKPFRFDEKLIRAKSLVRLIHYVRYLDAALSSNS